MSQGSVATRLMCHGVFNDVITNNYRSTLKVNDVELGQELLIGRVYPVSDECTNIIWYIFNRRPLLLRPRERLRSIVISMSVCLSVCVCVCVFARIYPEPHARSLPNFWACFLCPWLGPPPARWLQAASPVAGKGVTGVHVQCGRSVIYDCLVYYWTA